MRYLSSFYFFDQPLHVSGIFVARNQEVCYIYNWYVFYFSVGCLLVGLRWNSIQARPTDSQQKSKTLTSLLYIYIHSIPPHEGLQICSEHVEVN